LSYQSVSQGTALKIHYISTRRISRDYFALWISLNHLCYFFCQGIFISIRERMRTSLWFTKYSPGKREKCWPDHHKCRWNTSRNTPGNPQNLSGYATWLVVNR